MQWPRTFRRLSTLSPWTAFLLLALGCGGDKSPTGPGGGNGNGNGNGNETEDLTLVSLGKVGLPADLEIEDCTMTRFYGGGLVATEDGGWTISLEVHDDNYGDWGYEDKGEWDQDGETVWFQSDYSGTTYEGTLVGNQMKIMYDWCYNGVPDVQLVFE